MSTNVQGAHAPEPGAVSAHPPAAGTRADAARNRATGAAPSAAAPSTAPPPRPRLSRPRSCMATGVSAGLATHLGWPVGVVRAIFVVLALFSGLGILLYCWFWAFMPFEAATSEADTITRRAPVGWGLVVLSALAAGVALYQGRNNYYVDDWPAAQVVPPILAAIVLAVGASFWVTFIDRIDPERGRRTENLVRTAATIVLGVLVLAVVVGPFPVADGAYALLLALVLLLGIALVFAPLLLRLWRELGAERTRRVREEQRSEIAAHLHDSVLQTLALIQNRAGASSEVARIARAQERELRSWLFEADAPADSDLATDLRDWAAALELDYPVRVDVVVVGESGERASGEIAAAAREAMLNAARHAGGEVSVYIEGTAHAVEVFVRDRGPGFAVADVAADRLGVRESIIGRMRRAGGSATVGVGAGGTGTEVRLRFGAPLTNGAKPAASAEQTTQNGATTGG